MKLFDYHFYRIARAYFKRDGIAAPTAIISVSSVEFFLALSFVVPLFFVAQHTVNYFTFSHFNIHPKYVAGVLAVGLLWFNHRRYSGRYWEHSARWQHQTPRQQFIGKILVILSVPGSFAFWITSAFWGNVIMYLRTLV